MAVSLNKLKQPYFVFVMGPTGVGKSSWALKFGKKLKEKGNYQVEIINCDSVQVYQKLKIGSALPSSTEMKLFPHHLYSYINPEQKRFTVAQYRKDFFQLIQRIQKTQPTQQMQPTQKTQPTQQMQPTQKTQPTQKMQPTQQTQPTQQAQEKNIAPKVFLVVGGTGFYFQALEKGIYKVKPISSQLKKALKEKEKEKGFQGLHQELQKRDPEAGARIHPNDHYRILRALELIHTEKKTLKQIQKESLLEKQNFPYPFCKVFLDISPQHRKKILQDRIETMFQKGFVQEVQNLLKEGLKDWTPLSSVGYKELSQFLHQHSSPPNLIEQKALLKKILQAHLYLSKRQRTWFKKENSQHRFFLPEEGIQAEEYVKQNIFSIKNQ